MAIDTNTVPLTTLAQTIMRDTLHGRQQRDVSPTCFACGRSYSRGHGTGSVRRDAGMPSMPVRRLGSPRRRRAMACRSAGSGSWSAVVHGEEQQFQGRRLPRQRAYLVRRFWLWLRGRKQVPAPAWSGAGGGEQCLVQVVDMGP